MTQLEYHGSHDPPSLAEQVATHIHRYAHGRIRNLIVEENKGTLVVSGEARTWHARQLALQGVLEVLPGGRFSERITVISPDLAAR